MKSTNFLDEWNRAHTSSPSYQDALDWAEQKMKDLNALCIMALGIQAQDIIDKACKWLRARNILTEEGIEEFRKAIEK